MPNIKSAKKRVKLNQKNNLRNRKAKSEIKTRTKNFLLSIKENNKDRAQENLRIAIKKIDQAASKKIYHKNTAARKKSRLAKLFNKLSA